MVFKLVRTDTEEPCKIHLPNGKHLIGRGKLLDCEDKRVSRNHGELEVTGDKVVIKALHQNPCFLLRKGSVETQILRHNCTSDISNGDKFGLLPNSYWYELLHSVDIDDESDSQHNTIATTVNRENNDDTESIGTQPLDGGSENQNDTSDLNETIENIPNSPSLISADNQQGTEKYTAQHSPNENSSIENVITEDNEADRLQVKTEPDDTPPKRSHSSDEDSNDKVKKFKTEPEIKMDPDDAQAGPSNNQTGSNSDDNKDQKQTQPTPNPGRERCMYGASCYRKNPQHKAQFSHPSDADWGAGAQAPCPFGSGCLKRDPRHWRDHTHPPGVHPPQPNLPPHNHAGMRMVQRRGNTFYINAHTVNFYDDHIEALDSDGESVDFDYEF